MVFSILTHDYFDTSDKMTILIINVAYTIRPSSYCFIIIYINYCNYYYYMNAVINIVYKYLFGYIKINY